MDTLTLVLKYLNIVINLIYLRGYNIILIRSNLSIIF